MKQYIVGGTVAAALIVTAAVASSSAKEPAAAKTDNSAPSASALKFVAATPITATQTEEVSAVALPSQALFVGFEMGGRLAVINAKKGQSIRKGQLIAQLDAALADAQVMQADAGVVAAEAQSILAGDVANRNAELEKSGSISDLQNKTAQTQSSAASAQLLMAKAAQAQARAARSKHNLIAPFDGVLTDAPDQIGSIVGPGVPLFRLEKLDQLTVKAAVSEAVARGLKVGSKVRAVAASGLASTDDAVLTLVIPAAEPQTKRQPIEVSIPNKGRTFIANTLVRLTLPYGETGNAFSIPSTSLVARGGEHVYGAGPDQKPRKIPVSVIQRGAKRIIVTAAEPLTQIVETPSAELEQQ